MKNTAREIANEVFDKAGWKVPSDYVCAVVVIAKDGSYGLATDANITALCGALFRAAVDASQRKVDPEES